MATVLSVVYHLEVVHLDPFQLVLVGTALETACFLFEIPTGVVADLYSRRRSMLIGIFLFGIGFLIEGTLPWFATVLLAQVVWGCGYTFITGALEAWIATEETGRPMDMVFMRGNQFGEIGGVVGVILGTLLENWNLQLPIVFAGIFCLLLGVVLLRIMPETNFSPALEERQGLLRDFANLFKLNLSFVKGAPVLFLFAASRNFCFMLTVFLLSGLMRTVKEPILTAWMNDHVEERMRATVFSTNGQLDSFGQIIGGPIVGLIAPQVSVSWGLACTAFLLLPALLLVPAAAKAGKRNN